MTDTKKHSYNMKNEISNEKKKKKRKVSMNITIVFLYWENTIKTMHLFGLFTFKMTALSVSHLESSVSFQT